MRILGRCATSARNTQITTAIGINSFIRVLQMAGYQPHVLNEPPPYGDLATGNASADVGNVVCPTGTTSQVVVASLMTELLSAAQARSLSPSPRRCPSSCPIIHVLNAGL